MNTQDIRWKQRIDNYNKALNKLTEAVRYFETGVMSEIERLIHSTLSVKLDDLNLPYNIDLVNYQTINEPALKEHINRVGIVFYSK